ncbi:type 1 glutamine amidotransferase domain-containing protein [Mucilaginibacter endophyticus]|uniref:type 1 glutamine amidotransferase domain-containing protein n=1 Tax=Mucilaginibacter endophyticus TaxID=2675003 RepID=UPI000E0DF75E|nr:type 1 glutamine amidotransferase domain-containing protein [Mucilaginibacter endophyticus]
MKTKFIILATMFVAALGFQVKAQTNKPKKVLFVVTSHDKMGNIDRQTGLWLGEFAAPYYTLNDAGIEITIASPKGGQAPIDTFSLNKSFATEATKRYQSDAALQSKLSKTVKLSTVNQKDYDAVFYPGGHGPMWDLAEDKTSEKLIENFYNHGKIIAFVCHGPVALKHAVDKNGVSLVKGRTVAGFTNGEEEAVGLTKVVPFLTEDLLKQLGGNYQKGADWSPFVVQDGLLITGQNPQSASLIGEKVLNALNKPVASN